MSLENDIRQTLSKHAMTVTQLACRLNVPYGLVNCVTGFSMFDVYEEDNEKLKVLGVEYKKGSSRTWNRFTPEILETIKAYAGKLPYIKITDIVNQTFGTTFSGKSVYNWAQKSGLPTVDRVRWTSEKDDFIKEHSDLSNEELTQALNKKFNSTFSEISVYQRFYFLGLRRRK